MNELYCKKCGAHVCDRGYSNDYPTECAECGMKFYPQRIAKMPKYAMIPGGGQFSNGQNFKGACFFSLAFCGLLFGSICFTIIGGIIISGIFVMIAMGDAIEKAEDMAGYTKHQIASM